MHTNDKRKVEISQNIVAFSESNILSPYKLCVTEEGTYVHKLKTCFLVSARCLSHGVE